jgi:nitroimidazol reductase NimA-like FMN-containing flavoprotein (pyridoxamine 5'-phosphate oxidase superfamily)
MSRSATGTAYDPAQQRAVIQRAMAKQSFCVLATSSPDHRPHAVGLMYASVDLDLYLLVDENSIKVRNVRENPRVAICIPVRKYPAGPPMAVQFQGTAEILAPDDPTITELLAVGRLKRIVGVGAAHKPGSCFLRVTPHRRISSYGLGIPLLRLMRDVTLGHRSVPIPDGD